MLENYRNWQLLYEDEDQSFNKAIDKETENQVLVISIFDPLAVQKSVKLLISETLKHYYDSFEDENGFHIVIKILNGPSLIKYLQKSQLPYHERVKLAYDWIKSIQSYDMLPDAIKIQLMDYEQIVVKEGMLFAREWINYAPNEEVDWVSVFRQIGETLEVILPDAPEKQSQFINLLRIGKHTFFSVAIFRKEFKDVFLYEKNEAIEKINFEFDIVLNDRNAGPPVVLDNLNRSNEAPECKVNNLEKDTKLSTNVLETQNETLDNEYEGDLEETRENLCEEKIATLEEIPLKENVIDMAISEAVTDQPILENHLTSEENIEDHKDLDEMPDLLPKSKIKRAWEDDDIDDLSLDPEFDELFSNDFQTHKKWNIKWKESIIIGLISLLIILFLASGVFFLFFKDRSPVAASFQIESTKIDRRVPFMNTSTGGKKIESYQWDLYYKDQWIQTFTDKDLFILFETEGEYKVILKVKDTSGNWSDPYEVVYTYKP